jgi:hypothetical protein
MPVLPNFGQTHWFGDAIACQTSKKIVQPRRIVMQYEHLTLAWFADALVMAAFGNAIVRVTG